MHQQQGRSVLLTPQQEQWLTIQRLLGGAAPAPRPPPPAGGARLMMYNLVVSDAFEAGILVLIMLNAVMLAMVHYNMNDAWQVMTHRGPPMQLVEGSSLHTVYRLPASRAAYLEAF